MVSVQRQWLVKSPWRAVPEPLGRWWLDRILVSGGRATPRRDSDRPPQDQ